MFFKKGISTEEQVEINNKISDLINAEKEDAVIIYFLYDNHNFTLSEAREELKKARELMGWYAFKDSKDLQE